MKKNMEKSKSTLDTLLIPRRSLVMVNTSLNKKQGDLKMNKYFLRRTGGKLRIFLVFNPVECLILRGFVFGTIFVSIISGVVQ
jgi:hypothetical protein